MSIETAGTRGQGPADLNRPRARFCCLKQDGQECQDLQDDSPSPPKTIGTRVAVTIKVLTDLFCLLRLRSRDIKVFQTFSACYCGLILCILFILAILLQTR